MLTPDRLRELLRYDPATGVFTWIQSVGDRIKPGNIAGCINAVGYSVIRIDKKLYAAHRLAWLYMTGEWPVSQIDHIDLNRANNKWENLRQANNAQNNANRPLSSNNTSGFKGVRFHKGAGKWAARIMVAKKDIHLGLFVDKADAAAAYAIAAEKYFGEFARV